MTFIPVGLVGDIQLIDNRSRLATSLLHLCSMGSLPRLL
jgi:hypothetical protein